jgi:biotin carboxyl carrier protein
MPGTILDIKVSAGQSVKKGDVLCVLEAMKMENDIPAPQDGVVASINVQKGASVAANDVLITLA